MDVNELAEYLKERGNRLFRCTLAEVQKIEDSFGVKLPLAYKEFLLQMGKGAGRFMAGSSIFYDEIFELEYFAKELLDENSFKSLPEKTFVFWMHQGYQFAFFYLDQGDDPAVYNYCEGLTRGDFLKVSDSITKFLNKFAAEVED
jgi:hypothetical protein